MDVPQARSQVANHKSRELQNGVSVIKEDGVAISLEDANVKHWLPLRQQLEKETAAWEMEGLMKYFEVKGDDVDDNSFDDSCTGMLWSRRFCKRQEELKMKPGTGAHHMFMVVVVMVHKAIPMVNLNLLLPFYMCTGGHVTTRHN